MITPSQISQAAHEVRKAVEPYIDRMTEGEMWSEARVEAAIEKVLKRVLMSGSVEEPDAGPREDDRMYSVLENPDIREHLDEVAVLEAARMVQGRSYLLSPGQRAWLREVYSMTPAATVTLCEVALWPETRHPRRLIIRSDEHVDPRRRHVLSKVTITEPGRFFRESAQRDRELLDAKPQRGTVVKVLQKGICTIALADGRELPAVTTLALKEGNDIIAKWHSEYDPKEKVNTECWKVVKCLDPKEISTAKHPVKRDKLKDLNQLLQELEGI